MIINQPLIFSCGSHCLQQSGWSTMCNSTRCSNSASENCWWLIAGLVSCKSVYQWGSIPNLLTLSTPNHSNHETDIRSQIWKQTKSWCGPSSAFLIFLAIRNVLRPNKNPSNQKFPQAFHLMQWASHFSPRPHFAAFFCQHIEPKILHGRSSLKHHNTTLMVPPIYNQITCTTLVEERHVQNSHQLASDTWISW